MREADSVSKLVERGALNVVRAGAQRSAIRIECIAARKSPRIRKKPGPAPPKSRFYETRPAGRWKPFTDADSRHNEDLLRIRILYFAPRRVTADVDVSAAGVEWIKNETGLAWNGSGHWKLRSARGLLRGRRRFRRRPVCRNLRRCMRRWSIRFARSGARCGSISVIAQRLQFIAVLYGVFSLAQDIANEPVDFCLRRRPRAH